MTAAECRVWVGCLGCYAAGALVGAWADALEAEELEPHETGLEAAGLKVPACGRLEGADEKWCLDLEGFGAWISGECSPAEAQRVAELLQSIEDDGAELEAVEAWVAYTGERPAEWDAPTRSDFEDAYCGRFGSGADYAESTFEDMGGFDVFGSASGSDRTRDLSSVWPFYCIDWERAWRELELGDGMHTADAGGGEVFVFRAN
jgi:hypothetical protein